MNELYLLHDKILARGILVDPLERINFSREEIEDMADVLPDDLRAEIVLLQQQISACLPEDFDYFAFVGSEEKPLFSLTIIDKPAAALGNREFDPEQSLFTQLRALDWETLRSEGEDQSNKIKTLGRIFDLASAPLPSVKRIQREFREEARDFIKEKRPDATRIHVLWWDGAKGMRENDYPNGEELRKVLPSLLYAGVQIISVVAFGQPLTTKKLDRLLAEARAKFDDLVDKFVADFEDEDEPPDDTPRVLEANSLPQEEGRPRGEGDPA